jgi:hypothetical protein
MLRPLLALLAAWFVLATVSPAGAFAQSKPADTATAATQPDSSAASAPAASRNVPVHFARSGRKVTIEQPLTFNRPIKTAILRAYGRTWTEPFAVVSDGMVLKMAVTAPKVRVPTVFSVTWPEPPYPPFSEVVAYPDRDVEWDRKVMLLAAGAPRWFEQWAKAVGLPAHCSNGSTPTTLPALLPDSRCLVLVGLTSAGKSLREFSKTWQRPAFNVLVLEARWLSPWRESLDVAPDKMRGSLAPLRTQKWVKPLSFSHYQAANRILCNRWSWIEQGSVPPLEIVGKLQTGPWAVLNGIPWQEQLGRRAEADELLLEVMKAAAGFSPKVETIRQGTLLYPEKVVYDPRTMGYCPALACMTDEESTGGRVLIVDLRGPGPVSTDRPEKWTTHANAMTQNDRLLVLGDDPILDRWEWLKLDRTKKTVGRPRVIWLEDDQAWDKTYEIPLMLKLTELGVPLAPPEQKEKEQ